MRIAGFLVSNFIGLAIVAGALQFYSDAGSLWDEDSFIKSDFMVINKRVTTSATLDPTQSVFSNEEIALLKEQPWLRNVGEFKKANFRVRASVGTGNLTSTPDSEQPNLTTAMFFEAIPDEFLDVDISDWHWTPEMAEIPVIISKDYLALYNFGFASSAGLPQLSESMVSGIPLSLVLTSEDGQSRLAMNGRVAGYSSRFNTILVPESFLDYMNAKLSHDKKVDQYASRLILDISSPGDAAIAPWLENHGMETARDNRAASASYMLKIIVSIVVAIGTLITLLSLFILMLGVSLLMEKNRPKLHSLLMLGYPPKVISEPYRRIILTAALGAAALAVAAVTLMRAYYLTPLKAIGAEPSGIWMTLLVVTVMTIIIIGLNFAAVSRRVISAWK